MGSDGFSFGLPEFFPLHTRTAFVSQRFIYGRGVEMVGRYYLSGRDVSEFVCRKHQNEIPLMERDVASSGVHFWTRRASGLLDRQAHLYWRKSKVLLSSSLTSCPLTC